jgi:succinyl-CoA synthetase beta subunit
MARLLENHSLDQIAQRGVPVPGYRTAASPEEAQAAADDLGGQVVLKALVPVGGRGKGGAVRFIQNAAEASSVADELLGSTFKNFTVEYLLVSERLDVARELFVSFSFDSMARAPLLLFSAEGGIEIETLAAQRPDALQRHEIDVMLGLREFEAREVCARAGVRGSSLLKAAQALVCAYRAFRETDAALLEINPLAETTDGRMVAASALLTTDDQAAFRHPELQNLPGQVDSNGWRPLTPLELAIKRIDRADPATGPIRFNEFEDGDVGFMITGGGAGLVSLDAIRRLGGCPATTFDIKIGQIEQKMYDATKAVLQRPGLKGLICGANFANFTGIELKVRGVVRALKDLKVDCACFPVVLRLCGPNQDEARRLASEVPGLEYHDDTTTLEEAVERFVGRVNSLARARAGPGTKRAIPRPSRPHPDPLPKGERSEY